MTFFLRGGETWRSPWDDYAALRDAGPVVEHVHDGRRVFVLPRFEDVFVAVRDAGTFSSAHGLTLNDDEMALFADDARPIVMMDPPDHTRMRLLVNRPMTPRAVAPMEASIAAFVDERLDVVAEHGESPVDIVEHLFKPLPSWIVAHYLGIDEVDRAKFDVWTDAIVAANAGGDVTSAGPAALELFEFAMTHIERTRADPGDDLVSDLVRSGDDRATAQWILGFIFTMITGGNDTTTGLLGGSAELLTEFPAQRGSVTRKSVDEFLRLTTPVQNLARTTTTDVSVGGTMIPSGSKVLLLYGSANRDEREFGPDAGELDVRRGAKRMLALGYGPHLCLGASIARLAGAVTIERLLARFPEFSVDAAAGRFAPGPFVRRYETLPFTAA